MLAAKSGPDEYGALTVRVRREPGYVLITVAGEVDYASVAGPRVRLFRVTGLDQAVSLAGTMDEALGMLASAAKAV